MEKLNKRYVKVIVAFTIAIVSGWVLGCMDAQAAEVTKITEIPASDYVMDEFVGINDKVTSTNLVIKDNEPLNGFVKCMDVKTHRQVFGYSINGYLVKGVVGQGPSNPNYYYFDEDGALLCNVGVTLKTDSGEKYLAFFDGEGNFTNAIPSDSLKILE